MLCNFQDKLLLIIINFKTIENGWQAPFFKRNINHSANTSATMQTHAVLSGSALGDSERGAAAAEAFFESFDRLFDSPCHHLLEPTMRYLVESGARERCRPKFTTTSWASRSDAAAVSLS